MKTLKNISLLVVIFSFSFFFAACQDEGETRFNEERMELQSKIEASIDELDNTIAEVQSEMESAAEESRMALNQQLFDLQESRSDLAEKLNSIGEATTDSWEEFKSNVNDALDNAETKMNVEKPAETGQEAPAEEEEISMR